jgi:hypothetical protein
MEMEPPSLTIEVRFDFKLGTEAADGAPAEVAALFTAAASAGSQGSCAAEDACGQITGRSLPPWHDLHAIHDSSPLQ